MGSLILLLLVIDRRAKAVARARAEQVAAHVVDEEARRAATQQAALKAEWENRRRQLHELLVREQEEVSGRIKNIQSKASVTMAEIQTQEAFVRDLRLKLEAEAVQLDGKRDALGKGRADISRAGEKAEGAKHELARLAAELLHLEQTLQDLRALRERDKQTYSLVPYLGRHGAGRRPIYVECTVAGLVFHPDRLSLEGPSLSPMRIRGEVEHRIAHLHEITPTSTASAQQSPYLLMLVRPDGIASYYRAQAALVGLKIDFGYEFIEADWILDFSADGDATAPQPWMTAGKTPALPSGQENKAAPGPPRPRPVGIGPRGGFAGSGQGGEEKGSWTAAGNGPAEAGGQTSGGPWPGRQGTGQSGGTAGIDQTGDGSGLPFASQAEGYKGYAAGMNLGVGPFPSAGVGPPGTGSGGGTSGPVSGTSPGAAGYASGGNGSGAFLTSPVSGSSGLASGQGPDGIPHPAGDNGNGSPTAFPRGGTPGSPGATGSEGSRQAPALPGEPGFHGQTGDGYRAMAPPERARPAGSEGNGTKGNGTIGGAPSGAPSPGKAPGSGYVSLGSAQGIADGKGAGTPTGSGDPAATRVGTGQPGGGVAGSPSGTNTMPGDANGAPGGGGPPGQGSIVPGPPGSGDGGGEIGSSRSGFMTGDLSSGSPRAVRPPPLPLSRLLGNRDWPIVVECQADTVVVRTLGLRISLAALESGTAEAEHLKEAVQKLIANRQGTLRPGEPPYRPILRFQVHPDGLRVYYLAYPRLEELHLPMTRENVEPPPRSPRTLER
jgi:hypothetical protein